MHVPVAISALHVVDLAKSHVQMIWDGELLTSCSNPPVPAVLARLQHREAMKACIADMKERYPAAYQELYGLGEDGTPRDEPGLVTRSRLYKADVDDEAGLHVLLRKWFKEERSLRKLWVRMFPPCMLEQHLGDWPADKAQPAFGFPIGTPATAASERFTKCKQAIYSSQLRMGVGLHAVPRARPVIRYMPQWTMVDWAEFTKLADPKHRQQSALDRTAAIAASAVTATGGTAQQAAAAAAAAAAAVVGASLSEAVCAAAAAAQQMAAAAPAEGLLGPAAADDGASGTAADADHSEEGDLGPAAAAGGGGAWGPAAADEGASSPSGASGPAAASREGALGPAAAAAGGGEGSSAAAGALAAAALRVLHTPLCRDMQKAAQEGVAAAGVGSSLHQEDSRVGPVSPGSLLLLVGNSRYGADWGRALPSSVGDRGFNYFTLLRVEKPFTLPEDPTELVKLPAAKVPCAFLSKPPSVSGNQWLSVTAKTLLSFTSERLVWLCRRTGKPSADSKKHWTALAGVEATEAQLEQTGGSVGSRCASMIDALIEPLLPCINAVQGGVDQCLKVHNLALKVSIVLVSEK